MALRCSAPGGPETVTEPSLRAAARVSAHGASDALSASAGMVKSAASAARAKLRTAMLLADLFPLRLGEPVPGADDLELDQLRLLLGRHDAHRRAAFLHVPDLVEQQPPELDDAEIRHAETFLRPVEDRALRLPGHDILGKDLVQPIFAIGAAHREIGDGHVVLRAHALALRGLEEDQIAEGVAVVD